MSKNLVIVVHVPAFPTVLMRDTHVVARARATGHLGDESVSDGDHCAVLGSEDICALVASPPGSGIAPIIAEVRGNIFVGEVDKTEIVRSCGCRSGKYGSHDNERDKKE